jgi:hypothetical protein
VPDGQMEVRSESLRQSGSDLQRASDALDQAWKSFQPDAKNLPYGQTDTVGSLIGPAYEAVLEWAQTSYDSAVQGFAEFGEAIRQMADTFDASEQANTGAVEDVGRSL